MRERKEWKEKKNSLLPVPNMSLQQLCRHQNTLHTPLEWREEQ
jgi:hypothetical protein